MLSVIIATDGNDRATVATLAALVPGATAGLVADVLLLDCLGSAPIREIADASGCELMVHKVDHQNGRIDNGLMIAARRTRAPWLLFLQAGAVLQPGWVEETMAFIEQNAMRATDRVALFRPARAFYGDGQRPGLKRALWRWLPGRFAGKALLISRGHYEKIGGHPAQARRPEAKLLWQLGWRARVKLQSRVAM